MKGRLVLAAVLMLCAAAASAQSLQCTVGPQPAVLGQPLTWTVTARDLKQPLPVFTPAQFARTGCCRASRARAAAMVRGTARSRPP
jgi:hypothetical protein